MYIHTSLINFMYVSFSACEVASGFLQEVQCKGCSQAPVTSSPATLPYTSLEAKLDEPLANTPQHMVCVKLLRSQSSKATLNEPNLQVKETNTTLNPIQAPLFPFTWFQPSASTKQIEVNRLVRDNLGRCANHHNDPSTTHRTSASHVETC